MEMRKGKGVFLPEGRGEGRRFLSEVNGVVGGL